MNGNTTLPRRAAQKDYPAILGVPAGADPATVKRKYRELAREHHPDQGGSAERSKEITEAYDVLSDPQKRAQWEAARRGPRTSNGAARESPWESPFENPFGSSHFDERAEGDPDGDILNLFRRIRHVQAPTHRGEIHLDALQALQGHEATITIGGQTKQLQVPAGITEDTELLVDGHTLITIHVHPHPQYRIQGEELEVEVPVQYPTLVLGGEIEVPTPYGPARVRVPPGTQAGSRLRLAGRGARIGARRTSLYARLQIQVPRDLAEEAKKHLEEYAQHLRGPEREHESRRRSRNP